MLTVQDIGCDFNSVDAAKRTCMHYACQFKNFFAVKWLWGQGLPIDKMDKLGYTPLMFACQSGNVEIIKLLMENGADSQRIFQNSRTRKNFIHPTRTMLHFACESGNLEAIMLFDIVDVNSLSYDGTYLSIVVKKNSLEAAKYFIEKGADPNIGSEMNDFPILDAAENGNLEILKILVDSGADVNAHVVDANKHLKTPLNLAFKGDFTDCVLYLLSKNADTKSLGRPPLIIAATNENYELFENLLKIRSNLILERDSEGNNVFHFLGYSQALDVMNSLLPDFKPQDAPNKIGLTPLGFAALKNKEESVKFFIENGSNPNNRDAKDFFLFILMNFIVFLFLYVSLTFSNHWW